MHDILLTTYHLLLNYYFFGMVVGWLGGGMHIKAKLNPARAWAEARVEIGNMSVKYKWVKTRYGS